MSFHDDLVARLEYFDGHSDTLGLFAHRDFLRSAAARRLIEACGGVYAGCSLLVDQLPDAAREELDPVASVALADELRG